jgi:hypothetical protein
VKAAPDWIIWYTPGPRARAEFKRFNTKEGREFDKNPRRQRPHIVTAETIAAPTPEPEPAAAPQNQEPTLLKRLVDAGVTETVANGLVRTSAHECERQLEFLPYRSRVKDRGAYLVRAIRDRYAAPSNIEKAKRAERDAQNKTEDFRQESSVQLRKNAEDLYFQFFEPAFKQFQLRELAIIQQQHEDAFVAFKAFFDLDHRKTLRLITSQRHIDWFTAFKASEFFNVKRPDLGLKITEFSEWDKSHNSDRCNPLEWYNANAQAIFRELNRRFKETD